MIIGLIFITLIVCASALVYKYMDVIADTGKPPFKIKCKKHYKDESNNKTWMRYKYDRNSSPIHIDNNSSNINTESM